jgi:hypothetical protein
VATPIIGARYWFQERMGIDAGLGFGFGSSSASVKVQSVETSADGPAQNAFALHAGIPIAFAQGKHYTFLVVPEANFAYAWQTVKQQNVAPGQVAAGDIHFNGLRLDIGARVGTEIQFGFIGVPELALQASVGLAFQHFNYGTSQSASPPTTINDTSSSLSVNKLGTTVQSDPWALFVNNISAIYYFP